MGSNEALGMPTDMANSGLGVLDGGPVGGIAARTNIDETLGGGGAARASGVGPIGAESTPVVDYCGGSSSSGKRKRAPVMTEDECALFPNITDSACDVLNHWSHMCYHTCCGASRPIQCSDAFCCLHRGSIVLSSKLCDR